MATTTNTLRLKVGGKYKTRDGRVAEVHREDTDRPSHSVYRWTGSVSGAKGPMGDRQWGDDGRYLAAGGTHKCDLVSEIQDEAPAYRYFRYKNHESNFSGQDMRWRVIPGGRPEACDICDGVWRMSAHADEASLEESSSLVECDADGNPLEPAAPEPAAPEPAAPEPAAPEYRYFRWGSFGSSRFPDSRWRTDGKTVQFRGSADDAWGPSAFDPANGPECDPMLVECDADGNPIWTPNLEPPSHDDLAVVSFKTTGDLTPEQRTRIAKLAARIVLADGPVFTVDELTGLTVAELVAKLETITPVIEL